MKDKTKIILIYVTVAVFSAILITVFVSLGKERRALADESEKKRPKAAVELVETISALTDYKKELTEDLKGLNQDGEEVGLYDLKGKTVVFAQFYSRCSMCLGHNKTIMQELHEELKSNPDVHFVTVTLDPDFDSPEKLKESANVWGADVSSWWMMNVQKDKLTKYCREQLWYFDFKDNEKKTSIADAISHDMGIAVIDSNSKLRTKVDLFKHRSNDEMDLYHVKKAQLLEMIEISIAEGKKN